MTQKDDLEKSQLLNGYLDDQLSPRQITELKRLLSHDPQMSQDLEQLARQTQLLRTLPVESAPQGMAEDIKSALERRFILNRTTSHPAAAHWRNGLRRIAAVAALVLVPMLALGLVVYTILRPTPGPSGAQQIQSIALLDRNPIPDNPVDVLADCTPILQFQTAQPIAAADFIEKKIHAMGLMNVTVGQRESDRASYKITCSQQYIEALIEQLAELWPRCEKTTYALLSKDGTKPLAQITQIQTRQVLEMLSQNSSADAVRLALAINEQNIQNPDDKTNPDAPSSPLDKPIQPILAWSENNPAPNGIAQDTISIVIEILGQ